MVWNYMEILKGLSENHQYINIKITCDFYVNSQVILYAIFKSAPLNRTSCPLMGF